MILFLKRFILIFVIVIPATTHGQSFRAIKQQNDRLTIDLTNGKLEIIPLADFAIRIKFSKNDITENKELILVNKVPVPKFDISESKDEIKLKTRLINVIFDKHKNSIKFTDNKSNVFLSEIPGSRKLIADTDMGQPCYIAEQSFDSPEDEYLFGLGQFQDGHFNLKNVSRKLIQVNSQISIPFIYSNRGYGILWHQYGLTYFNPAGNEVKLTEKNIEYSVQEASVTTSSGTQIVKSQQALYTGKFTIENDGRYSMMLDLGNMDNRQLLIIDDSVYIDQSNLWLPPAISTVVDLKKGTHTAKIICKSSNRPQLSWQLTEDKTTFRSPNAKELDYVVFYGDNADEVIGNYRNLSGNVPMLPRWAYGFWQCRERYTTSEQLIETVEQFRDRKIPMDVIVQDWQYWGDNGWGVPQLDETRYPNPSGFIGQLHDLNAHFNISIWSNPSKDSKIGKEYASQNLYIKDSPWLDYFNPETRKKYWNTLNNNLFRYGVDSWWMDATEPENDALAGKQTWLGPGDFYRLTYPMFVSKAVYEGQRNTTSEKRVCILTRSAFAGQQRYGTINWSGDIGGTWESFSRQIIAGLDYSLTGMPFWTTDIGGFFRPGSSQYTDKNYHELLIRWYQWGAFNPVFRIHGYQSETEPWNFGKQVEDNMRKMLALRYRLIPYIYSEAWQVTRNGSTMMRPLVMDFDGDREAIKQKYEYMFGKSFLVAPVTKPEISNWKVYLPEKTAWYDFWTEKWFKGGQTISTEAPLDKIPLFVKAGSIVPLGKPMQYTSQKSADTLEIRIYAGANGKFELYEDEGDNYNYEKGEFTIIPFIWDDNKQKLTIAERQGKYPGSLQKRIFNIVLVNNTEARELETGNLKKQVNYTGKNINIILR